MKNMKISDRMVSAGVAAMAEAKQAKLGDDATITTIWSAMDEQRRNDEERRAKSHSEPAYTHQSWPSWRYPPDGGMGRIFHSAAEVPEGWVESVEVHPLTRDASTLPPALLPPSLDLPKLRAEYKAKFGRGAFNGWDAAKLREKLAEPLKQAA